MTTTTPTRSDRERAALFCFTDAAPFAAWIESGDASTLPDTACGIRGPLVRLAALLAEVRAEAIAAHNRAARDSIVDAMGKVQARVNAAIGADTPPSPASPDIDALAETVLRAVHQASGITGIEAGEALDAIVAEVSRARGELALADAQIAQKDALLDALREADGRRLREVERLRAVLSAASDLTSWDWSHLLADHPDAATVRSDAARLETAIEAARAAVEDM